MEIVGVVGLGVAVVQRADAVGQRIAQGQAEGAGEHPGVRQGERDQAPGAGAGLARRVRLAALVPGVHAVGDEAGAQRGQADAEVHMGVAAAFVDGALRQV
ncbi:hypothetical protein D3C80_1816630 [compost metagenome]